MHGRTEGARGFSEQLALQHFFADADQWLGRLADVLIDRQDQLPGQRGRLYRQSGRFRLVSVEAQPAVQLAEIVCRCRGWHQGACMLMQSTGQGATQSSQPVHSCSITVCISWWAPTMASTGHAARQ